MQSEMKKIELDFTISEVCSGRDGIKAVFNRLFAVYKGTKEIITLAIVLWKRYENRNFSPALRRFYKGLWQEVDSWCLVNLHQADFDYYVATTKSLTHGAYN